MSDSSKIDDGGAAFNVGLFIVTEGHFGWSLCEITEVRKATIKAVENTHWARERTINKTDCRFVGPEERARELYGKLVSSYALCNEERRNSYNRRIARDDAMIAASKTGGPEHG